MPKSVIICAGTLLVLVACSPGDARAQWPLPLDGRVVVSVNGGGQTGSSDISRALTFELYRDAAQFASSQRVSTRALLDVGATVRLAGHWGVGAAFTTSSGTGEAAMAGSLPHPLLFGQPRSFTATAAGLDTRNRAVHAQAVMFIPFVEKVDFVVAGGPSFFNVEQAFARTLTFSEVPPAFNSVSVDSIEVVTLKKSAVGFNLSAEATYAITQAIGAGLLLRYTGGTVNFDLGDQTSAKIEAGGFQALLGGRLRF